MAVNYTNIFHSKSLHNMVGICTQILDLWYANIPPGNPADHAEHTYFGALKRRCKTAQIASIFIEHSSNL
jgi:hypothetical protein